MDINVLYWYLFLVFISIVSVASVIWFFRKRRELIIFLRDVVTTLETYYRPSDKEYVLLGYLVGFKARYVLPRGHRVYILFTTVPRHVLLYLPLIVLFKRRDRIEVAIKPYDRFAIGELYVHRAGSWTAETIVKKSLSQRLREFSTKELSIGEHKYIAYYKDETILNLVYKILRDAKLPILYLYATSENIISVCSEATRENLKTILDFHRRIVDALTKTNHSVKRIT